MSEDPEDWDFATGEDLTTGMCQPCKQGCHLDCRSVGATEDPEMVWPFFAPEPGEEPAYTTEDTWVCGCLQVSRLKHDDIKHGEDE